MTRLQFISVLVAIIAAIHVPVSSASADIILVRNTNNIPDGMMGSHAGVPDVGSAWWMPGTVFSTPESGVLHSMMATVYGGSTQFGPWSESQWLTVAGYRVHFWGSESGYFASPGMGEQVVTLSQPSNSDWHTQQGVNHVGWPTYHFEFDVSSAGINVVPGQSYVIGFQAISSLSTATGFVYHSLSDGGFGQHLDLFASYSMSPAYLWEHGAPSHYHATEVYVQQIPSPGGFAFLGLTGLLAMRRRMRV